MKGLIMFKAQNSMQKISFYANLLEKAIIYIMIAVVITFVVGWIQDKIPVLRDLTFWLPTGISRGPISSLQVDSLHYLREMSFANRAIGFIAEGGLVAVVLTGLFFCIKLMRYFKNGEIFSLRTISLLRKISVLALIWAIYAPMITLLLSAIAFHETTEQRSLSIAYATDGAFIMLLFFGFLLVLTLMLQEGYYLKSEQDLTV